MSISKPRIKSAVLRKNDSTSCNKTLKGTTNASSHTLDSNNTFTTKVSPKNGQNTSKILPLSTNITNANKTATSTTTTTTTTTTILPQTNLLKIEPFVPSLNTTRLQKPIRRSYSTLSNTTLKKRSIQQHHVNNKLGHNLDLAGGGGGGKGGLNGATANTNMVNGVPKILKQPTTTLRRRPTLRGNINRQRSKSTSSSNSNSNRPNTSAVTVNSTPSLGTPCSSPFSALVIQQPNGICRVSRNAKEQEKLPDRINYDKRGLTAIPIFENETNLRLLSLQHNLINTFHIPKEPQDDGEDEEQNENRNRNSTVAAEENLDRSNPPPADNIIQRGNNHHYAMPNNKQRFPLALTTPNVEQLQTQYQSSSQSTTVMLQNLTNPLGFATYASLQRSKLMQQRNNLQTKTNLPQTNLLRFGKSQSFINNFNLQINLNKRALQNQRTFMLRKAQGHHGNLKSFDSSTSNLTSDSTISTLLTSEMENGLDLAQGEEEEGRINSLSEMEIKNKQLIISYGMIFNNLVFLDLYDNQIEKISNLDGLPSLTVLLLGKNRISDITGLSSLKLSLRVLDLHGNKLCSIANKINCLKELKSLNLAGNQIRQINHNDFLGLNNLKELNLKRNKLKRINGFQHLSSLERLWLCHNDLHKVDDMSTIAKAYNLIEITIENNPLTLAGDCVSFLVSYLPKLQTLSQMPITEQVRKAAMTWRTNKELSEANAHQQHSNKEVFNIIRREEIISNARTNWELLRSQQMVQSSLKQQNPNKSSKELEKITEANENNYEEFIKLPPIEQQQPQHQQGDSCMTSSYNQKPEEERSSSASSLGPNVNSSSSCYSSQDDEDEEDGKELTKKYDNNGECQSRDLNNKHSSSSMKSKQQTDNNTNQTSTDNNNHQQHHSYTTPQQQLKCNPATIRTPSAVKAAASSCAPTLNLQFPMENSNNNNSNKVSANQQNQTVISTNATSVSSLTCSTMTMTTTQQTVTAVAASASNSLSSVTSVTQASTYCKRYMTGSLMRSQTIVGTVAGATPNGNGGGGCGSTSGYTVKTNTITTTANNIRYQSKLNPSNAAGLTTHQQTPMMTTITTGASAGNIDGATYTNNLISASATSSSMYGHNISLTLNSNKTLNSTTTTTTTIASSISTTGLYGSNNAAGGGATTTKLTAIEREREQGGDYLIEICGRYLNIYGQGALRFIDKQWNPTKANDVHTLNFSYINFNNIASILGRIKVRFPHAENFVFRETNINSLGQLNALAELQGISSLTIDIEGNPITSKDLWRQYAIYRLSHWGLKMLNSIDVTDGEIEKSNQIYAGLSDLILWSMPDAMLQPLLTRLRLDESCTASKMLPKQWLQKPDNKSLRLVVGKEALQWKKSNTQEHHHHHHPHQQLPTPQQVRQLQKQFQYNNNNIDCSNPSSIAAAGATAGTSFASTMSASSLSAASSSSSTAMSLTTRERGKIHFTLMMENTCNAVEKLHKLDQLWPTILLNIVRNTLLDYTQLDVYIRNLMAEIMKQ